MALTKTQVSELYVAIFNRASEGSGNSYWQGQGSAAEVAQEMLDTPDAKEYFGTAIDDDKAFIEHIYINTLGKTYAEDAEGIDFWVARLANGESRGEVVAALVAAAMDPQYAGTPAQQQFLNRVEVSDYAADNIQNVPENYKQTLGFNGDLVVTENPGTISPAKKAVQELAVETDGGSDNGGQPGSKGETFFLTEGRDKLEGTDGADTFYGFVGQNQNGTLANELATGDIIDGGAGRDKIIASLQADLRADSGVVASVNPRTTNVEEVHIEALDTATVGVDVLLDAGRMDSVEEFWSDNSSADFTIRDVRLGSKLNITKDITFGLRETDFDTDFTALFDSQSLTAASSKNVNSALSIRVADVSALDDTKPLANVKMNLSFKLGGETITLSNIVADGGTYLGLVTAIRTALVDAGYDLDVAVGAQYNSVTIANNTVNLGFTASELLIVDPNGESFTDIEFTQSNINPVPGGFLVAGNADNAPPSVTSSLIESNLILDNAGRGSTAGDVLIGGMSNSNKGVEQFNVTVDRNSKIASLNTTNNTLQNIIIDSKGANGSLTIGQTQDNLLKIDANAFKGASLTIGNRAEVFNLEQLQASSTSADVNFYAEYDGSNRSSSKQEFFIATGAGSDHIEADVVGTSTSGSTQTTLTINAGNGNNTVIVDSDAGENVVTVTTGSGSDVIRGNGATLIASTGAGDDVVYAENTGFKALAQVAATAGVVASVPATDTVAATLGNLELMAGKQLTVTLAVGDVASAGAAAALVDGFESKAVTIKASNGSLTTQADINNAIVEAINTDPVLNKLAKAFLHSDGNVYVEYLVDGVQIADSIDVTISNAVPAVVVSAAMQKEYRDFVNDSSLSTAAIQALYDDAAGTGALGGLDAADSVVTFAATTITVTTPSAVTDTITVEVAGKTFTVAGTGVLNDDAAAIAEVLADNGVYAQAAGAVVSVFAQVADVSVSTTDVLGVYTPAAAAATFNGSSSSTTAANVVNGGAGNDVIVLSSESTVGDVVEYTGYNQGHDTIVHFETTVDQLDFTSYLTGTVPGFGSGSTSAESEVALTNTAVAGEAFTANSINLINFTDLASMAGGVTFDKMTVAQVKAALDADVSNSIALTAGLYQTNAKSVLIVHNDDTTAGSVNAGVYTAYELTYANAAVAAGTAKNFTVQLIGTFDIGADTLAVGDLAV